MDFKKKLKKGGIDTILAFVVVLIPLFFVLVFMIATLYHFSVQMYINQAVKESLIMASSYGGISEGIVNHLNGKLAAIDDSVGAWEITYGKRTFDREDGTIASSYNGVGGVMLLESQLNFGVHTPTNLTFKKGDLIGIQVKSVKPSLLGNVSQFGLFANSGENTLKYSAFREEIIRNDPLE